MTTSVGFFARTSRSSRRWRSGTLFPLMPAPNTSIPRSLCRSARAALTRVTYPFGRIPASVIESPRKTIRSPFFRGGGSAPTTVAAVTRPTVIGRAKRRNERAGFMRSLRLAGDTVLSWGTRTHRQAAGRGRPSGYLECGHLPSVRARGGQPPGEARGPRWAAGTAGRPRPPGGPRRRGRGSNGTGPRARTGGPGGTPAPPPRPPGRRRPAPGTRPGGRRSASGTGRPPHPVSAPRGRGHRPRAPLPRRGPRHRRPRRSGPLPDGPRVRRPRTHLRCLPNRGRLGQPAAGREPGTRRRRPRPRPRLQTPRVSFTPLPLVPDPGGPGPMGKLTTFPGRRLAHLLLTHIALTVPAVLTRRQLAPGSRPVSPRPPSRRPNSPPARGFPGPQLSNRLRCRTIPHSIFASHRPGRDPIS